MNAAYRSVICSALVIGAVVFSAGGVHAKGFTYTVERRRVAASEMRTFAQIARGTLSDGRGWSLGGQMPFRRAASDGDVHLILASPASVAAASAYCSVFFSCRVGDLVFINLRRWHEPPSAWTRSLLAYRHYVINHEVGHWLGLAHATCAGSGSNAPVMLQQSKALQGCRANAWPTRAELEEVAAIHGAPGWKEAPCEGERREDPCGHGHPRRVPPAGPHRVRPEPL